MYFLHKIRPGILSVENKKLFSILIFFIGYFIYQTHINTITNAFLYFIYIISFKKYENYYFIYVFLSMMWHTFNLFSFTYYCFCSIQPSSYRNIKKFYELEEKRMKNFSLWDVYGILITILNFYFFIKVKKNNSSGLSLEKIVNNHFYEYIQYEYDITATQTLFCSIYSFLSFMTLIVYG